MTNIESCDRPEGYKTELDTSSIMWKDFFIKAADVLIKEINKNGSLKNCSKDVIQNFKKNSSGFILNMSCRHPQIRAEVLEKIVILRGFIDELDDISLKNELTNILSAVVQALSLEA